MKKLVNLKLCCNVVILWRTRLATLVCRILHHPHTILMKLTTFIKWISVIRTSGMWVFMLILVVNILHLILIYHSTRAVQHLPMTILMRWLQTMMLILVHWLMLVLHSFLSLLWTPQVVFITWWSNDMLSVQTWVLNRASTIRMNSKLCVMLMWNLSRSAQLSLFSVVNVYLVSWVMGMITQPTLPSKSQVLLLSRSCTV